jgi:hypothetical protein
MFSAPEPEPPASTPDEGAKQGRWIAGGALIGAVLASACCIVPLVLVMLGISGAWIANLTALEPYKPYVTSISSRSRPARTGPTALARNRRGPRNWPFGSGWPSSSSRSPSTGGLPIFTERKDP